MPQHINHANYPYYYQATYTPYYRYISSNFSLPYFPSFVTSGSDWGRGVQCVYKDFKIFCDFPSCLTKSSLFVL